ncbi:MAG: hypothetical protein CMK09_00105 [Ponticaulis sp.]|nr:hypothetical protein [Ponticaulis sp.]|tara:strand:- start:33846 stop:34208 length:363 start_codon:yes stop_codon:yes gene_type:complete
MENKTRETHTHKATTGPRMEVDFVKYAHFLEGQNLSETQKEEQLQLFWDIVLSFVRMGWGVTSADFALDGSELSQETQSKVPEKLVSDASSMVQSERRKTRKLNEKAALPNSALGEGVEV